MAREPNQGAVLGAMAWANGVLVEACGAIRPAAILPGQKAQLTLDHELAITMASLPRAAPSDFQGQVCRKRQVELRD